MNASAGSGYFDLAGRTALVTGASRGIGLAIATALKNAGVTVFGTASRPESIAAMKDPGISMSAFDIRNRESVEVLMRGIIKDHGKIDCLINNAGVTSDSLASRVSEKEMHELFEINLKSVFAVCQAYYTIQRRNGCIINISSASGIRAMPGTSFYGSVKAGVIQLTQALTIEWARKNIRVNCVSPGFIKTDMNAALRRNEKISDQIARAIPIGYIGDPDAVAGPVLFLMSDAASYITGHNIVVDGGAVSRASF